jgi:MoaA/NifB/PqqE/SkfB family radical SAM enzyme
MRTKPYCKAPWLGLAYEGTVGCKPCCEWKGDVFEGTYTDYKDSKYLKDFKQLMYEDEIHPACIECTNTEERNIPNVLSRRQKYEGYPADFHSENKVVRFDYRPGNKCNLMCRMCWEGASSLIEEEKGVEVMHLDTSDAYDIDLSNCKKLMILGGEPSIDLEIRKWIDHIKDLDMYVGITTNATNASDKWFNKLHSISGKLEITLSVDAAGPVQEYQRHKSNWNEIKQNIWKYKENFKNLQIQLTATAINMPVLDTWWDELMEFNIPLFFGVVFWPEEYNLDAIPDEYKEYQIAWLKRWIENYDDRHQQTNEVWRRKTLEAEEAISILQASKFDYHKYKKFKNSVAAMDKLRNQNILDLDDRFEDIINE